MTAKLKTMSKTKKVLLGVGAFIVLMGIIGAMSPPKEQKVEFANSNKSTTQEESDEKSAIETKVADEVTAVPFQKETRNDSSLEVGVSAITTTGVNGKKIVTYEITYTDGTETDRKKIGERIDPQPINEVTSIGTKPKPAPAPKPARSASCDSNYSGCVPVASDVDCAGGSGNGPAYANGPIQVIGVDIYDLDRDGNGVACE